jgi:hypothetical protein
MTPLGQEIALRAVGTALAGAPAADKPLVLPPLTELDRPVDLTTTGSVDDGVRPAAPPRPVEIIAARADRVWLRIDGAIRAAAPGDDVPRVGHIASIVPRDGGWALVDDNGATLLTLAKRANGATLFARKRIFE